MTHYRDLHKCSSSDRDIVEECGAPASVKRQGRRYCGEHYDSMNEHASAGEWSDGDGVN
jgi:hypothetical protein